MKVTLYRAAGSLHIELVVPYVVLETKGADVGPERRAPNAVVVEVKLVVGEVLKVLLYARCEGVVGSVSCL